MLTFAAPIWLFALAPWAALVVWFFIGRSPRANVPFIQLWKDESAPKIQVRRALRLPPIAIIFALLSILLGLMAAGEPQIARVARGPIMIVVDRGVSMSANSTAPALNDASTAIRNAVGPGEVELIEVPGQTQAATRDNWAMLVARATGIDTRSLFLTALDDSLRESDRPIVALTNAVLPSELVDNPRIVQMSPRIPSNVGIAKVSARIQPKLALFLRLRNQSDQLRAILHVMTGSHDSPTTIDLPSRGEERNYFLDLAGTPNVIGIVVDAADEMPADNRAWLVRTAPAPMIEPRTTLAPELTRLIEVYRRHRAGGDGSSTVVIVDDPSRVREGQAAAVIARGGAQVKSNDAVRVVDHPISAHVRDWNEVLGDVIVAPPPRDDWKPIVTAGEAVLVAVREQPARQVWIGFQSAEFARSADFVVFWTDVFDWLGGANAQMEYRCEPVSDDALRWDRLDDISGSAQTAAPAPGVYRSPDGALHALCALDIKLPMTQPGDDWRAKLDQLARRSPRAAGAVDLVPASIIAALAMLILAAITWRNARPAVVSRTSA